MNILIILVFTAIIASYLWAAYDIEKNRKTIHWLNIVALIFVPFLWPFIYFALTKIFFKTAKRFPVRSGFSL
ncbi:hypothetical protein [Pedobacter immunditicola]|uniref:hypothetical protein n=1 Tax=Pedobacter immunditicola TaxID=3133440 RepID=UPI0030A1A794